MSMKVIQESENFVVVDCKKLTTAPIGSMGDDGAQDRLIKLWLDFYEDLRSKGLRPVQRFSYPGPEAVVCERIEEEVEISTRTTPRAPLPPPPSKKAAA